MLDAWALIALLRSEPAATAVRSAIEAGALASWINLGEVLYIEARHVGTERATAAVAALAENLEAETPDGTLVLAAATVKATERVSYADAFAIATAERSGHPLLTGDPEIVATSRPALTVVDLR